MSWCPAEERPHLPCPRTRSTPRRRDAAYPRHARPRRRAGDRSPGGRPRRRGRTVDRPSSGITRRPDAQGGCREMRTTMAATLESAQGQVVLEEVAIDAAVDDLMTVVDVRQRYRNPGTRHIEAVYTFPLPVEAVLLKFTVEIGDRKMARHGHSQAGGGTAVRGRHHRRRRGGAPGAAAARALHRQRRQPGPWRDGDRPLPLRVAAALERRPRAGRHAHDHRPSVRRSVRRRPGPAPGAGVRFRRRTLLSAAGIGARSPAGRPLGIPLARHRRHPGRRADGDRDRPAGGDGPRLRAGGALRRGGCRPRAARP